MNRIVKQLLFSMIVTVLISCSTNKKTIGDTIVNIKPNAQYKKSRKAYSGKLNDSDYKALIEKLETELNTNIPDGKSVLINFNQRAPNCISARFIEKNNISFVNNVIQMSSRISSNNNTVDFFVYTSDSFSNDIYKNSEDFILDSGFFIQNIFTENENCAAFFIVKPDGDFYKYYGEDYYSEVIAILAKE